jgi:hypothetical protein
MAKPATPVTLLNELAQPLLQPIHPVFFSSELASQSLPSLPQALSCANEAEYNPQSGCIDPRLLSIVSLGAATNANLMNLPEAINSPDAASSPGMQRPGTADEGSNVGNLYNFIF